MSAAQEVIPAAEIRAAEQKRTSLVEKMANKYGLEPNRMMSTLKATAFRGDVTNAVMPRNRYAYNHSSDSPPDTRTFDDCEDEE